MLSLTSETIKFTEILKGDNMNTQYTGKQIIWYTEITLMVNNYT